MLTNKDGLFANDNNLLYLWGLEWSAINSAHVECHKRLTGGRSVGRPVGRGVDRLAGWGLVVKPVTQVFVTDGDCRKLF